MKLLTTVYYCKDLTDLVELVVVGDGAGGEGTVRTLLSISVWAEAHVVSGSRPCTYLRE